MLAISDFSQLIKKIGLQRTNRFQIMIKIPKGVFDMLESDVTNFDAGVLDSTRIFTFDSSTEKVLSLTATQVMVPGYNVTTTDLKVGLTRRVANDVQHGELTIVFRCTGEMAEKKIFDAWRKLVQRPDRSLGFYDTYISSVQIMATDQNDNITYETTVTEAYPVTVTELSMNREEMDAFATFSVTFTYRKIYNQNEDYGEKRKIYPPAYTGGYELPEPPMVYDIDGLPRVPARAVEYPGVTLTQAPATNQRPVYLNDAYTAIDRIKARIEDGTLDPLIGSNMLKGIGADIAQQFEPGEDMDALEGYVGSMVSELRN